MKRKMNTYIYKYQRTPKRLKIKRSSSRNIIINLSKVNGKERILKTEKERKLTTYRALPQKTVSRFLIRNFAGQETVEWYIQSAQTNKQTQNTTNKNTVLGKVAIQKWRWDKTFPDPQKSRVFISIRLALEEMPRKIL